LIEQTSPPGAIRLRPSIDLVDMESETETREQTNNRSLVWLPSKRAKNLVAARPPRVEAFPYTPTAGAIFSAALRSNP